MFEAGYPFRYINTQTLINEYPHLKTINYSFTTAKNRRYLVLIHEYEWMVLVIKFHEANKRHLHNRFNVILNDFDCSKILRTVINIAEAELKKNQFASFAFVGVPKEGKETRNTANSQRHRIYRKLAEYFLGPQTFLHSYEQRSNCYLLVNKRNVNPAALQTAIVDMFAEHFHELSHL